MDRQTVEEYLTQRQIPELFQTLMLGMIYHRPDNPIEYLLDCLDYIQESGPGALRRDIFLNTRSSSAASELSGTFPILPPIMNSNNPRNAEQENVSSVQNDGQAFNLKSENVSAIGPQNETEKVQLDSESENNHQNCTIQNTEVHVTPDDFGNGLTDLVQDNDSKEDVKSAAEISTEAKNDQHASAYESKADRRRRMKAEKKQIRDEKKAERKNVKQKVEFEPNKGKVEPGEEESDEEPQFGRQISEAPPGSERPEFLNQPLVMDILRGSLDELPHLPSNTVRIFLSSTFSDFKAERNILPKLAYPELRRFCGELGIDFQVVDMRWGVTDELMNDHQVSELCIREIKTCQQVSCGPSFVTMLGDRYGYRPYPAKIDGSEFEILMEIAEKESISGRDTVKEWYHQDENAVPSQYILQPIASKLKYYNDVSAENNAKRKEDRASWSSISNSLLTVLRSAVKKALDGGKLTHEQADKYLISVTEEEIRAGLFEMNDTEGKILCFHRQLQGIENNDDSEKRWKFVDLQDNSHLDEEAKELRTELIHKKIPTKIKPEEQMKRFEVPWRGIPLEEADDDDYMEYLKEFASQFVSRMMQQISKNISSESDHNEQLFKDVYFEALYHARFATKKCEIFCGREETLSFIQTYIQNSAAEHPPLFISGQSGFGKTALLAATAMSTHTWLSGSDYAIVLRFMGTSPQSSNILLLLRSVIHQICAVFDWIPPNDEKLTKIGEVRMYFWSLLERVHDQMPTKKLVIILDSVDQLATSHRAHSLLWLPKALPPNIFIVVSILSDQYLCLANAKKRFTNLNNFYELPSLSSSNGLEIINSYMKLHSRRITGPQESLVLKHFEKVSQPLFLKLTLDQAAQWCSYDPVDQLQVPVDVHDAISKLLENIEVKYGRVFVARALSYLTCGHVGLSGLEMEDVLSCDDEVLNEIYQFHDPPLEGTIRLPSLLWARVENELREYLAHRQVDGKTVMTWYHRQFWEAAENRYLANKVEKQSFHAMLAALYEQESGISRTITLHQRGGKVIENADRRVTPQLLRVSNIRKLNALPHHLLHANQLSKLKETCLLNYNFLLTKLKAVGISAVLDGFTDFSETFADDEDLDLMGRFLEMCYDSLRFDSMLLAYNVVARLGPVDKKTPACEKLVLDASEWVKTTTSPLLFPTHSLKYLGMDSPLRFAVMAGFDAIMAADEQKLVCIWSDQTTNVHKVQTLNIAAKDIMNTVMSSKITPLCVTRDSDNFIYIDHLFVYICEIETGDLLQKIQYTNKDFDQATPRSLEITKDGRYLAVGVRLGRPTGIQEGEAWKLHSYIGLIDLQNPNEPVREGEFKCRKHVESLLFVEDDEALLVIARPKICKYAVPSMDLLTSYEEVHGIHGYLISHAPESNSIAMASTASSNVHAFVYNYKENRHIISQPMGIESEGEDNPFPFAVQVKQDLSVALVGLAIHGQERKSCIYSWDITQNSIVKHSLSHDEWKTPSNICVTADWNVAFIGWKNGHLSVLDLNTFDILHNIHAHGGQINYMKLYQNETMLATVAQDHFFKVWDVEKILEISESRKGKAKVDDHSDWITFDNEDGIPPGALKLDPEEQCLHVACSNKHAISAPPFNMSGPKFWKLEDGALDLTQSVAINQAYVKSLEKNGMFDDFNGRTHGDVLISDDLMIYVRKKRDKSYFFITKGFEDPQVVGHFVSSSTFFYLTPAKDVTKSFQPKESNRQFMLVKDGALEIIDIDNKVLHSIDIPKITDDVNIMSNTGKRKLIYYRTAITYDGKYFIIVNPAARKKFKYLDLIDLEAESYVKRVEISFRTNWLILEDGCYFLVWKDQSSDCEVLPPSRLSMETDYHYKCLLYSQHPFVSTDQAYGLEYCRGHGIRVWQLEPLEKKCTLIGHEAELTTSVISYDNKYVASGSFDHTVRIWSLEQGSQLACFYVFGAVDNVMFTPNMEHVVVHCYSAPQRKRAVVLKLYNLK